MSSQIDENHPASEPRNGQNSPAARTEPAANLEQLAERVDRAVAEVKTLEPEARSKAMALKSAIEEFHKAGLTHIVRRLKDDPNGRPILFELAEEPAVYALFSMHSLVRADLRTQVSRVIEMVRPYMQSHGGDVSLVDVRDKTVYVRLSGNCNGCSMSSVTLRNTVEESLREHVPEIEGVEVVPEDPAEDVLVQLGGIASEPTLEHGWVPGPPIAELTIEKPLAFEAAGQKILLLQTAKGPRAYRNACAHQGLPLEDGLVDPENGTITCPWHGFPFDGESGECLSAPQCRLEPFPLRIVEGTVWVRPE